MTHAKTTTTALWAVHCLDGPDCAGRRHAARPAHSARLRSATEVQAVFYGPLMAEDGSTAIGSLFLIEAADREAVERFVAEDPFTLDDVWRQVDIRAFAPSGNSPHRLMGSE